MLRRVWDIIANKQRITRRSEFGGKWTEEKLNSLGKYLHAYTTIFHSNPAARHFRTVYVDAFAGTGKIVLPRASETSGSLFDIDNDPDAREYLKGSARLALEVTFLKNRRNSPLFLLCFAAANPAKASLAVKIAQQIIGK